MAFKESAVLGALACLCLSAVVTGKGVSVVNGCDRNLDITAFSGGGSTTQTSEPGFAGALYYEIGDGSTSILANEVGEQTYQGTKAELRAASDQDYYDLSVVDGFNFGMDLKPADESCVSVSCRDAGCPDAFQSATDDAKSHTCSTGNAGFTMTVYC